MALSKGMRHIDDLPDEVFTQILDLVPLKQVIRCATVSKRWDAACRYIIRTRESLVIGDYESYDSAADKRCWDREGLSQQMDGITLDDASLVSAMMKTLNQMMELKRLYVEKYGISPEDVIPFIRKFPDQLTMLAIDFPVSMIGADSFPHLTRLRCREFDANSSAAFPKLAHLITCELVGDRKLPNMRLPSLKKLLFPSWMEESEPQLVIGLVLANAANLTFLEMNYDLQLGHAVVFPNLIELDCCELDVVAGCSFPALTRLRVAHFVTPESLSCLPADQMLSLDVNLSLEAEDLVSISKMRNLKSLKLRDGGWDKEDGKLSSAFENMLNLTVTEWGEVGEFSSIFDNMHDLEEVRFHHFACNSITGDAMIATLADQNPKLSRVSLKQICLTDADLTSLSQLQHLTYVKVSENYNVTTAGVLTLLRGASRYVFRKIVVLREKVDGDQLTSEIELMCEERGTTFDALVTTKHFEYVIHV